MTENSLSVLTTNITPTEEKITGKADLTRLFCAIFGFIISAVALVLSMFSSKKNQVTTSLVWLLLMLICLCVICDLITGFEIIINISNHTMTLITKSLCKCCGPSQKTIDLNQVNKLHIYKTKITIYIFYYKDGSKDDVTKYFECWVKKDLYNCLKLLRKYFIIDCDIPELKSNIELTNSDFYSMSNPEIAYNSNMMSNQVNNNIGAQNYNTGIPQNVQQNYNSGGDIYADINTGNNTSYSEKSNL